MGSSRAPSRSSRRLPSRLHLRGDSRELQAKGFRVLIVAVGSAEPLRIAGVIALSDPRARIPRRSWPSCMAWAYVP